MLIVSWLLYLFVPIALVGNICTQSEPSPEIMRIVAQGCAPGNHERNLTGFLVTNPPTITQPSIVTALHGVANCNRIGAISSSTTITQLELAKVDFLRDIALLSVPTPQRTLLPSTGLTVTNKIPLPDQNGKAAPLCAIGYPAGIKDQWPYNQLLLQTRLGRLYLLLPSDAEFVNLFSRRQSPGQNIRVLRIDGELAHGVSGAPLLNSMGEVIGIIEGGLKDAEADTVSWAIPWGEIDWDDPDQELLQSLEEHDPRLLFSLDSTAKVTVIPLPTSTSTPIVNPTKCPFWIQIVDLKMEPVRGAEVRVIYGLDEIQGLTDSNGDYYGEIVCDSENPRVEVDVTVNGVPIYYDNFRLEERRQKFKIDIPDPNIVRGTFQVLTVDGIQYCAAEMLPASFPVLTPEPIQTSNKSYPCNAELFSSTGASVVNRIRAIPSSKGTLMDSILVGTQVEVREERGSSEVWYHIFDEQGRELGWVLYTDIMKSPLCPD